MPNEYDLDNMLIAQKNLIIQRIDSKAYNEAYAMLAVVRELWQACRYTYKYNELQNRILLTLNQE